MKLQTASEHDIVHGMGRVMGMVRSYTGRPAWALPGGRVTLSRNRDEWVAREIGRVIGRRPLGRACCR